MAKKTKTPRPPRLLSQAWAWPPERLGEGTTQRQACQECALFKRCPSAFRSPSVGTNWTGKILGIGESTWTGEEYRLLRSLWRKAGWADNDIAWVYALRCAPPLGTRATMNHVRACRPFLQRVIDICKPEIILTFGSTALQAVTNDGKKSNVTENRGRLQSVPGIDAKIFATYDPISVLSGNLHHQERILEDFCRTQWKPLRWPKRACPAGPIIGVDSEYIEWPSSEVHRQFFTIALSDKKNAESYRPDDKQLRGVLRKAEKVVAHSAPVDIDALVANGLCKERWVQGRDVRDSLWVARLADENRGPGGYKLENILLSRHQTDGWKAKTEGVYGWDPRTWPPELRDERCRLDAWATLLVAEAFLPAARGKIVIQHRIGMALQRVYHAGAYVDMKFFNKFSKKTDATIARLETSLKRSAKRLGMSDYQPTNKNHLRELVYEHLGVDIEAKTDGGAPSVNKLALKAYAKSYPVIAKALEHGKVTKIKNTYIEGTKSILHSAHSPIVNGKAVQWMPVRINPLGARTLRRSSGRDPFDKKEENGMNFQNWTKAVKPIITTRFRRGMIVDNDYHKLEAILVGWLAGEEKMVDYFLNNPNGYISIAGDLFKKTVEKDTPDYRVVKALALGINYNMGVFKLASDLWTIADVRLHPNWQRHRELTEDLHFRYMAMFPKLKRYQRDCISEVEATGQIVMTLGYLRRLPIPPEPPKSEKHAHKVWSKYVGHVHNEAINCRAQHLASLITGTAMIDVEERLLSAYNLTYLQYHEMLMNQLWPRMPILINEVHDDLIYDTPEERRKRNLGLIKDTMEELPTLRKLLPDLGNIIRVDQVAGPSWGVAS